MRSMKRITTALVLAVVALAGAAAPAAAQQDNAAVAINTKDDSSIWKLAFSIKQVSSEVVHNTNVAAAVGSCERCETVAIAIQVLILTAEHPIDVSPQNLALALNVECPECVTVALAYQLVIGTGDPLRLTAEGRQMIADIRRELRALRDADLDPVALDGAVGELVDRLREVIRTQLVPRGSPGDFGRDESEEALEQPPEDQSEREMQEQPPPQEEPPPQTPSQEPAPAPEPAPESEQPAPPPEDGGGTTTTP